MGRTGSGERKTREMAASAKHWETGRMDRDASPKAHFCFPRIFNTPLTPASDTDSTQACLIVNTRGRAWCILKVLRFLLICRFAILEMDKLLGVFLNPPELLVVVLILPQIHFDYQGTFLE